MVMLRVMPQRWDLELTQRIASEIRRLRGSRSAQWLALTTGELGYSVTRSVIADLENGRRKYVTVPELIVLAEALGVAPLELLYGDDDGSAVRYLPNDEVQRLIAVQRFSGIDDDVLNRYEEKISHLAAAAEETKNAAQILAESLSALKSGTTALKQVMANRQQSPEEGGGDDGG